MGIKYLKSGAGSRATMPPHVTLPKTGRTPSDGGGGGSIAKASMSWIVYIQTNKGH